jgi:hypothetical protein
MGEGDNSRRKAVALIALVIAILIIFMILIMNLPKLLNPEDDTKNDAIYKQFEKFEGESTTLYKNEALNVSLTRQIERMNITTYVAEWIDIWGNSSSARGRSPESLFDEILREAQDMTVDQIKWYEYLIEKKVE